MNNKNKKLSFEDLICVSGGESQAIGDKTFQQEKYRKHPGPFPERPSLATKPEAPQPEQGLQNSSKERKK